MSTIKRGANPENNSIGFNRGDVPIYGKRGANFGGRGQIWAFA